MCRCGDVGLGFAELPALRSSFSMLPWSDRSLGLGASRVHTNDEGMGQGQSRDLCDGRRTWTLWDGWMDGWMDRRMDACMHGWADGRKDGRMH